MKLLKSRVQSPDSRHEAPEVQSPESRSPEVQKSRLWRLFVQKLEALSRVQKSIDRLEEVLDS